MSTSSSHTHGLTMDLRSLDRLKAASGTQAASQQTIKETAKQLEGLFMQELLKSMRATTMNSGMLENAGTEMGTSMLDTQLANHMTGLPGGLSTLIERQLARQMGVDMNADNPSAKTPSLGDAPGRSTLSLSHLGRLDRKLSPALSAETLAQTAGSNAAPVTGKLTKAEIFIQKHQEAANAAEKATGIPAANILGQAALESGWGRREIRSKDGTNSHNLFGIKATSAWKGPVAEVTTTEYIGGVARKVTAKFRAYASYEEAFKDHARLLSQSPRYSAAMANVDSASAYAQGLHRGGYATDPSYAEKLTKVIQMAQRVQQRIA